MYTTHPNVLFAKIFLQHVILLPHIPSCLVSPYTVCSGFPCLLTNLCFYALMETHQGFLNAEIIHGQYTYNNIYSKKTLDSLMLTPDIPQFNSSMGIKNGFEILTENILFIFSKWIQI